MALNKNSETFVIYIASLNSTLLNVYPSHSPQISGLIAEKIPIKVSNNYVNFADVFSSDLASKLPKHTGINDHTIELIDG